MTFVIGLCELFHPYVHGYDIMSSEGILNHYLVHTIFTLEEFYDKSYIDTIDQMIEYSTSPFEHPTISNYKNISKNVKLHIMEVEELKGGETVAYIKTHWIRLIQRRWRTILQKRKEVIKHRSSLKELHKREITGKWSMSYPRFTLGIRKNEKL
jgi:hypothetical protein